MKLNCTDCPWGTDREACRACVAENRSIGAEDDMPGAMERANTMETTDIRKLGEFARKVEGINAETAFHSFLCLAGEEHVHYIIHGVDEVVYHEPKYGYQN